MQKAIGLGQAGCGVGLFLDKAYVSSEG